MVKDIWNGLIDGFLENDLVWWHNKWYNLVDTVDRFGWALRLGKGVSFGRFSEVLAWLEERMHGSRDDFCKQVKVEAAFRARSSRFFVTATPTTRGRSARHGSVGRRDDAGTNVLQLGDVAPGPRNGGSHPRRTQVHVLSRHDPRHFLEGRQTYRTPV